MIEFRNVHKTFGQQEILKGLSLKAETGQITVIMGPSGVGKSVTLKLLLGLLQPDQGQIFVNGEETSHLNEKRMNTIRRNFGMLFQDAALFDSMNVFENVAFPLREHTELMDSDIAQKVRIGLKEVGLENIDQKLPSELSGGMRKRVGLARAIMLAPQIILFDEPTTGLDPISTAQIGDLVLDMQRARNCTVLLISHDLALTYRIADYVGMLYKGNIVEFCEPKDLKKSKHPFVKEFLDAQFNLEGRPR